MVVACEVDSLILLKKNEASENFGGTSAFSLQKVTAFFTKGVVKLKNKRRHTNRKLNIKRDFTGGG